MKYSMAYVYNENYSNTCKIFRQVVINEPHYFETVSVKNCCLHRSKRLQDRSSTINSGTAACLEVGRIPHRRQLLHLRFDSQRG